MATLPQDADLPFLQAAGGDKAAADQLFASLYEDLKNVARARVWNQGLNPTVGPTAAVNILYEKWVRSGRITARNRAEFFVNAAVALQQILVDQYRRKKVRERDRVPGEPDDVARPLSREGGREVDEEAVCQALAALRKENDRQYRSAMMRYYDGLEVEVIAETMGLSARQVRRDLRAAEAFVRAHLGRQSGRPSGA